MVGLRYYIGKKEFMKIWGAIFLFSTGIMFGHETGVADHGGEAAWAALMGVSALGWLWYALAASAKTLWQRATYVLTGRAPARPTTDPKALAAEVAALNAQISQLRDTATSFDVSFDQTLQRMDERLRRVEQQAPYVQTVSPRQGG